MVPDAGVSVTEIPLAKLVADPFLYQDNILGASQLIPVNVTVSPTQILAFVTLIDGVGGGVTTVITDGLEAKLTHPFIVHVAT